MQSSDDGNVRRKKTRTKKRQIESSDDDKYQRKNQRKKKNINQSPEYFQDMYGKKKHTLPDGAQRQRKKYLVCLHIIHVQKEMREKNKNLINIIFNFRIFYQISLVHTSVLLLFFENIFIPNLGT